MNRPPLPGLQAAISLAMVLLQASFPDASHAQYMYLDTNGDGVHTEADTIRASGPTLLDVWLRTDANRDGSPAACIDPNKELRLAASYVFALQATGGTINWGTFTNRRSSISACPGARSNPTEFFCGICGTEDLPPGLYRLASISLEVAGGTPSLHIRPLSGIWGGAITAFGSPCPGMDNDNTIKFGTDWFDVDGARYGGWLNPPVLQQPSNMSVAEMSATDQFLNATDPDGSTMTFTKASGPDYMTVRIVSSDRGMAVGSVHLAPDYSDSGVAVGEVEASDGVGSDFRSFGIHVSNVNRAPILTAIPNICIEQGQTERIPLHASDPDQDSIVFTGSGLPPFANLIDYGYGFVVIDVVALPNENPASYTAVIRASDGAAVDSQFVTLRAGVLGDCSGRAPIQALAYPNPTYTNATLSFWTSRPGRLLVTLYDLRGRRVRTLLDDLNAPPANYQVPINGGYWGNRLPAGVYFYRIEGADGVSSGRIVFLRGRGPGHPF